MAEHGTVRLREFAAFAKEQAATIKARRHACMLPFPVDNAGHQRHGAADFLAWQLFDALTLQGFTKRSAALSVLASRAAHAFLDALALGHDVSDLHLVAWREAEDGFAGREVNDRAATMNSAEIAELRLDRQGQDRTWHRLDQDGNRTEARHARPLGVVSLIAVPIAPQWRAAVERARDVGLELLPGSVATIGDEDG